MDRRRLELFPMAAYKLKYLWHWIYRRRDLANAYSYIWATLFSRDAGLALMDPLIRKFHWLARYPKQLEVEITTVCNLKCSMCEHTYWGEPAKHMSFQEFKHIVDQFPTINWIGMTGIGSSFLNKDYPRMLEYMKRDRKSFVEFFDHFNSFNEERARKVIELGVNKIWVSLEHVDPEKYNDYRKGGDFETMKKNVWQLVKLKRELKSPIPELWFHNIINRENIDDAKDYIDFVAEIADYERGFSAPLIYWSKMLAFDENDHLAVKPSEEWIQEVKDYCSERRVFSVINMNVQQKDPMTHCVHWTEPFVLVTGHIQACCALNEANTRDWQKEYAFANLFKADFRDWWKSSKRKEFQKNIREDKINEICRYCHIYPHPDSYRVEVKPAKATVPHMAAREDAARS